MQVKVAQSEFKVSFDLWDRVFMPASGHQRGTNPFLMAPGPIPTPLFFLRHTGLWFVPDLHQRNPSAILVRAHLKSI